LKSVEQYVFKSLLASIATFSGMNVFTIVLSE